MVWTDPRTWVNGEKPTAATMNLHIRDNLAWLKTRAGTESVPGTGTTSASVAVVFSTAMSAVPVIIPTPYNTPNFKAWVSARSTTGFTLNVARYDGAVFSTTPAVDWVAVLT